MSCWKEKLNDLAGYYFVNKIMFLELFANIRIIYESSKHPILFSNIILLSETNSMF